MCLLTWGIPKKRNELVWGTNFGTCTCLPVDVQNLVQVLKVTAAFAVSLLYTRKTHLRTTFIRNRDLNKIRYDKLLKTATNLLDRFFQNSTRNPWTHLVLLCLWECSNCRVNQGQSGSRLHFPADSLSMPGVWQYFRCYECCNITACIHDFLPMDCLKWKLQVPLNPWEIHHFGRFNRSWLILQYNMKYVFLFWVDTALDHIQMVTCSRIPHFGCIATSPRAAATIERWVMACFDCCDLGIKGLHDVGKASHESELMLTCAYLLKDLNTKDGMYNVCNRALMEVSCVFVPQRVYCQVSYSFERRIHLAAKFQAWFRLRFRVSTFSTHLSPYIWFLAVIRSNDLLVDSFVSPILFLRGHLPGTGLGRTVFPEMTTNLAWIQQKNMHWCNFALDPIIYKHIYYFMCE